MWQVVVTVIVDLQVDVFAWDGLEALAAEFVLGGSDVHVVAFDEVVDGDGFAFKVVEFAAP